ncbi:hypothetical protein MSG28_005915 [Choristoneura fumiferana]|uniref:Uncharacterized protein n=1 Tax=Choristoneura fumiferana TaxID=7141 RepID=A0ACC0L0T2_CHOFU|nr:hypothetical protein MSG28_005915 [Choristoneura fumiferana]
MFTNFTSKFLSLLHIFLPDRLCEETSVYVPAIPPNSPTMYLGTGLSRSPPLYQSRSDSTTKNRMAWLLPCFMIVAVTPLYTPPTPVNDFQGSHEDNTDTCVIYDVVQFITKGFQWLEQNGNLQEFHSPSSRTMVLTPWKKPRNLGFSIRMSLMNLTLTVSMGVTANTASATPAASPHPNLPVVLSVPSSLLGDLASPDSRLGDGAIQQYAKPAVQPEETMALDCLLHAICDADES